MRWLESTLRDGDLSQSERLVALLEDAKRLAKEYYRITGRPLGITGEVGEYEAVRLLGLKLAEVRQEGYDAIGDGEERFQIKTRVVRSNTKPSQRVGQIDLKKPWDAVLLVLLDEDFEATAIFRAERSDIEEALLAPGSRARNERGQLPVSKFRQIGTKIWPNDKE